MKRMFPGWSVGPLIAVTALIGLSTPAPGMTDLFSDLDGFVPEPVTAPLPAAPPPPAPAAQALIAEESDSPAEMRPEEPVFAGHPEPPPAAPPFQLTPPDVPPALVQKTGPFFLPEPAEFAQNYERPSKAVPPAPENCIEQGKRAWRNGEHAQAQALFEAALHQEPGNPDAIRWLRYIADKKSAREEQLYQTTRARMLETVQAAWNTPPPALPDAVLTPETRGQSESEMRAAALLDKLRTIRIPAIAFHDADVQQAVLELSALCRKLDPERKGANMVVFGTAEMSAPLITFSGTDLSVFEALEIVTQMTGMKFEAGSGMIRLTPVHYEPPQQMVPAEFDIPPAVGRRISAQLDSPGSAASGRIETLDVRGLFSTVPFPPGSSARFNPEFNVLLVHNIPKYVERLADLLGLYSRKVLEEQSQQVEIETKFIEVSQGALEELGFDWSLGTPGQNISSDTWTLPGGQKLFTDSLRSGQEAFGQAVRDPSGRASGFNTYATPVPDPAVSGLVDAAGELLIRKVKGDLKADLLIRALERSAGSDLLSAPRIVTRSGETASIHVGEVRWFPTAFNVKIERDTPPALVPEFYEEERTGVLLEVTPELDSENGTIRLTLAPELRELAGFDEQHVGTIWPTFGKEDVTIYRDAPSAVGSYSDKVINFLTAREQNRTIYADRLIARRPVFNVRKMNTAVTIEDGSTLALGGLIKEQLETFTDRVPLLGSIPLVGRLFRSEGERSIKRNLLIFVTANRIDAAGRK